MRLLPLIVILLFGLAARPASAEPDLTPLSRELAQLRAQRDSDVAPNLAPAKQAVRHWIEQQLPSRLPNNQDGSINVLTDEDLAPLVAQMNAVLGAARLTCGREGTPGYRCRVDAGADWDAKGYVEDVRLGLLDGERYLLAITGIGVVCGYDESAYVFEQQPDSTWRLLWTNERNNYADAHFVPEQLIAVNILSDGLENPPPPLITTLSSLPTCTSNWSALYTRLWRASATTTTPSPLLDREDGLFTGGDFVAAARLTDHDLLVQYEGGSIDSHVFTRSNILHYRIAAGDKLEPIAPVALDPQSFVETWLESDWAEAKRWSDNPAGNATLARLHPPKRKSPDEILSGSFGNSLRRCRAKPSLWQVAFTRDVKGKHRQLPTYFQVRWMPPYRFTLVAASYRAFAGCDEKVATPDDVGTLFPFQGWRADAS